MAPMKPSTGSECGWGWNEGSAWAEADRAGRVAASARRTPVDLSITSLVGELTE